MGMMLGSSKAANHWFYIKVTLFLHVEKPSSCRVNDDVCEHGLSIQKLPELDAVGKKTVPTVRHGR